VLENYVFELSYVDVVCFMWVVVGGWLIVVLRRESDLVGLRCSCAECYGWDS
jgi:hypothetical protein